MTIKIGGEAGQGVESSGAGFVKALSRGGVHVFGNSDYMSRIRGGYNFYQIRASFTPVFCHSDDLHLLLALNGEAITQHKDEMVKGGAIIYDEELKIDADSLRARGILLCPMPLVKLAYESGANRIMANTAAIGAAVGITEYDFERIAEVIRQNFQRKGEKVVQDNLKLARQAHDIAKEKYAKQFKFKLSTIPNSPKRMILHGNQAISLGAIGGGCRFMSGYPMTPASTIIEFMSAKANQFGIVTKQTEDEISAILMAIGANHAGVRAMTATSGGGFSLMVEALGLAGITETPLVIVEAQRTGPSTGLPTRTEQADLEFVLRASQGEFPRIILAPGTIEQCFEAGWRAFNLAEKYQCPVIILTDLYQSAAVQAIDKDSFDFSKITIERGALLDDAALDKLTSPYKRHAITESGISPRAIPSHPNAVFMTTSDEHDEMGHVIEDAETRIKMMQKRMRKLELAVEEMKTPEVYGAKKAEITLIGWGSTYGALREAVDRLNEEGTPADLIHFVDIWPFPEERVTPLLKNAKYTVCVEGNYTGQLANILRTYTGIQVDKRLLRYDGRPFSPGYILAKLKEEVRLHV